MLAASGDPTMAFAAGHVDFNRGSVRREATAEGMGAGPAALGREADDRRFGGPTSDHHFSGSREMDGIPSPRNTR